MILIKFSDVQFLRWVKTHLCNVTTQQARPLESGSSVVHCFLMLFLIHSPSHCPANLFCPPAFFSASCNSCLLPGLAHTPCSGQPSEMARPHRILLHHCHTLPTKQQSYYTYGGSWNLLCERCQVCIQSSLLTSKLGKSQKSILCVFLHL